MTFNVRLYFSVVLSGKSGHLTNDKIARRGGYRLSTFAYPKEVHEWIAAVEKVGATTSMIIDSGAFTTWNSGGRVNLKELIDYNKMILSRYGDHHGFMFISLDVIPGERGRRAGSEEIAKAVDQSIDNFKVMQQEFPGHYILPVYHSGEDVSVRNTYMQMTDYICLSMDQTMSEKNRIEWAARSYVEGFKFHGLAATGNRMITEVPWFSVDSAGWLNSGSMGSIYLDFGEGLLRKIKISDQSPERHDAGQHYDNLPEQEKRKITEMIIEKGYDPEQLRTDYMIRHLWNIDAWFDSSWRPNYSKVQELF